MCQKVAHTPLHGDRSSWIGEPSGPRPGYFSELAVRSYPSGSFVINCVEEADCFPELCALCVGASGLGSSLGSTGGGPDSWLASECRGRWTRALHLWV